VHKNPKSQKSANSDGVRVDPHRPRYNFFKKIACGFNHKVAILTGEITKSTILGG
jgi:hypothetical protein